MINIAICDDLESDRRELRELVTEYFTDRALENTITEYSSGEEYLKSGYMSTDILLLDEEMPKISGMEVKEYLRKGKINTQIIFVTSHTELLREAYGHNVVGFITKPSDKDLFYRKMDEAIYELPEYKTSILKTIDVMLMDGTIIKCPVDNIIYIKASDHYSIIYLEESAAAIKEITSVKGITEYAAELMENFFVTQRSYLLNLKYAEKAINRTIGKRNGFWVELNSYGFNTIPLGKRRRKDFEYALKKYRSEAIFKR